MQLLLCISTLVLLAASSQGHRGHPQSDFQKFWEISGIVGDAIDYAPTSYAEVYFPSGVKAKLDNELTPTEVKNQPYVSWDADKDVLYTVTFIDLDAPSRRNPLWREIRLWLVSNIPGNNIGKGQTLWEYVGAAPGKNTCIHRHAVLVFKQTRYINTDTFVSRTSSEGRVGSNLRKFIDENELDPKPVAGNSFLAQYDDNTPIIYAQVGGVPPFEREKDCPRYW